MVCEGHVPAVARVLAVLPGLGRRAAAVGAPRRPALRPGAGCAPQGCAPQGHAQQPSSSAGSWRPPLLSGGERKGPAVGAARPKRGPAGRQWGVRSVPPCRQLSRDSPGWQSPVVPQVAPAASLAVAVSPAMAGVLSSEDDYLGAPSMQSRLRRPTSLSVVIAW